VSGRARSRVRNVVDASEPGRIRNEGEYDHGSGTAGTGQGIDMDYAEQELSPWEVLGPDEWGASSWSGALDAAVSGQYALPSPWSESEAGGSGRNFLKRERFAKIPWYLRRFA